MVIKHQWAMHFICTEAKEFVSNSLDHDFMINCHGTPYCGSVIQQWTYVLSMGFCKLSSITDKQTIFLHLALYSGREQLLTKDIKHI